MKIIILNIIFFIIEISSNPEDSSNPTSIPTSIPTTMPTTIPTTIPTIIPSTKPTTNIENYKDDCLNKNKNSKYEKFHCYIEAIYPKNESDYDCIEIPFSSYYTGFSKYHRNNTLYDVTCSSNTKNIEKTFVLEQCGNKYGKKNFDNCKEYSSLVDSCCYFSGNLDRSVDQGEQRLEKGCYWLGSKYEGTIKWAGAELECFQKYLNTYFSFFSSILFFLLSF